MEDHLLDNMDSAWIGLMWLGSGRFALDHLNNYWLAQSGQNELKFEHIWTEKCNLNPISYFMATSGFGDHFGVTASFEEVT